MVSSQRASHPAVIGTAQVLMQASPPGLPQPVTCFKGQTSWTGCIKRCSGPAGLSLIYQQFERKGKRLVFFFKIAAGRRGQAAEMGQAFACCGVPAGPGFFVDKPPVRCYNPPFEHGARGVGTGGNNSVVECNLAKVEVASSNLVSRSNHDQQRFEKVSSLFLFDRELSRL